MTEASSFIITIFRVKTYCKTDDGSRMTPKRFLLNYYKT